MGALDNASSMEGDVYVQRLATYIRRNEEALANGLLCYSKVRSSSQVKPLRPSLTTHHLYYILERIENSALDVEVGPLNVKLDNPNHEPTFISFMANNARSQHHFESDAKSITSINSMKSMVSSASVYWMSFSFSKDPRVIQKDVKYLYLSFTKVPCLILSRHTKVNSISGYEEYPCDTSVPLKVFKNLQVLELVEYEPNEVFGWHQLSERLRILIVRNTKVSDLAEIILSLVREDENGRSAFSMGRLTKKAIDTPAFDQQLPTVLNQHRRRAMTASASSASSPNIRKDFYESTHELDTTNPRHSTLPDNKWFYLKQLTVTESSITHIQPMVFKPLANLVKLNLSNNLLEEIPLGLDQLCSMKYLNFSDNYITSLKNLPVNMKHLVTINFNNNKLENLEGLENLCLVEKIDLRRNKLSDMSLLIPLVQQVSAQNSKLNNIFISSNFLPKTYRIELFNLFNGAKPKNLIKIDDSRPGYFESAMLLDPDSARKQYEKFMLLSVRKQEVTKMDPLSKVFKLRSEHVNTVPLAIVGDGQRGVPRTPDNTRRGHVHSKSTGDVLDSISLLAIHDLEHTICSRKHSSVMTTASTTSGNYTQPPVVSENLPTSGSPSPSLKSGLKPVMPLLPNQNLCNHSISQPKIPPMIRQLLSPMIHQHNNGSNSTLRSSSTMTRLDFDSSPINGLAPNVITAVQVQVEGFQ